MASKFKAIDSINLRINGFWYVMPCSLIGRYKCFGKTATSISYPEDGGNNVIQKFITFSRLYGVTSEKREIFMFSITRTSNLTLTSVPMNESFAAAKKLSM
jgi:hypothetical protein